MVHIYQKEISIMSCDFLKKISMEIDPSKKLTSALTSLARLDDDQRHVMPGHLVTDTIINYLLKKGGGILKLQTTRVFSGSSHDSVTIYYKAGPLGLTPYCLTKYDIEKPCIIIEGITTYTSSDIESKEDLASRINQVGIKKIISCYMAEHDQYPGKNLRALNNLFPQMVLDYTEKNSFFVEYYRCFTADKNQSPSIGCCTANSSLFFIRHIYCGCL